MTTQDYSGRFSTSRKKSFVVAGLVLVFFVVVTTSLRTSSEDQPTAPEQPLTVAANVRSSGSNVGASASSTTLNKGPSKPHLPEIDLARIVAHNPFLAIQNDISQSAAQNGGITNSNGTKLTSVGKEVSDPLATPAEEEVRPTVSAVVTGGKRPAALINDKLYFEQDVVDECWKIEAILPQEVVFKLTQAEVQ